MRNLIFILTALLFVIFTNNLNAQCANEANIVSFTYNGASYEIVKENKSWVDAAACAVERGGFLTEINSEGEQNEIYSNLTSAGITNSNTVASDGGNASYVWIGGNDISTEGEWVWDGNNDGNTTQFWQGDYNGVPVDGLYNNWGGEPDDWNGQDALGLALTEWPLGSGSLGSASQWNDVDRTNTLYYVIEYSNSSIDVLKNKFNIYPNPATDKIFISTDIPLKPKNIRIHSLIGKQINNFSFSNNEINIKNLNNGLYFISVKTEEGVSINKFVKK